MKCPVSNEKKDYIICYFGKLRLDIRIYCLVNPSVAIYLYKSRSLSAPFVARYNLHCAL